MKGYKVFNSDWTCKGFQYKVGETYEIDGKPTCCKKGFHFCKKLVDCFNYYSFDPNNKVAEIESLGDVDFGEDKYCTNKIKIIKELSWEEVLTLINSGNRNTGYRNSGNCNSGNRNIGNYNSGDYNSGNRNSGNYNIGNYNKTNYSTGCFNTQEQTILMFNKPSVWTIGDWRNSKACIILNMMPKNRLKWVTLYNMNDEEKELYPRCETTGGYLKEIEVTTEDKQNWWNDLSESDRKEVLSLPNFDKDIFKEITGIDVEIVETVK